VRSITILSFIIFGISLFSFTTLGFISVSFTDIMIGLLILYALFINQLMLRSFVFYAMLFFAIICFFSGVVNFSLDSTFVLGNFIANYIRIIGLVVMLLLFPPLLRKIGHDRLVQATLWVLRLHALIVIADVFMHNPFWGEIDLNRPRGLFGEPSFFGIYMGLSLFYILQVEYNTGTRYLTFIDIALFCLSLLASISLSSVGFLCMFLFFLIRKYQTKGKLKLFMTIALLVVFIGMFAPNLRLNYLVNKIGSLDQGLQNESVRVRLLGSVLLSMKVLDESPLLGAGLGGANVRRLFDQYGELEGVKHSENSTLSLTFAPAAVLVGAGIIGFLPFVLIYIWLLRNSKTRLIGISLLMASFMWGMAFAPVAWWYICLAISLASYTPIHLRQQQQHALT